MGKNILKIITVFVFIILVVIGLGAAVGGAYIASVYTEFLTNKVSIFEKIEQFSMDLNKNKTSDIDFGASSSETDDIYKKHKRETVFYDCNGKIIAKYSHSRRQLVSLREIPYFLAKGFILIEDQQFYAHKGINFSRFALGIVNNIITMGHSAGGSTITQQLAKILFTKQERSVKRKIYEIFCTLELEKKFTKNEIITIYLNSIYLGHGVYGIADASDFYFHKNVSELTAGEAALLIGMNRSPERYSPIKNKENAKNVQKLVLNQFKQAGFVDDGIITMETTRFWRDFDQQSSNRNQSFWKTEINNSGYLTEYIRQVLEREFSYEKITEGGLIVHTTFDLEKQNLAESTIKSQLPDIRRRIAQTAEKRKLSGYEIENLHDVEGSLASIDFRTGEVLALVGGSGYTFANQFNRATNAKRSIGSSVKPFVYSYAINEKKIHPFSKFKDQVITYNINGQKYTPRNYSGTASNEMTTVYDALKRSLNTIPLQIMNDLPIPEVADFIRQASFLTSDKQKSRVPEVLSLALGTCELSALELATAYCIFPRLGSTVYPVTIKTITDQTGNVYYDYRQENNWKFNWLYPYECKTSKQLLDPAVAYEIVQMMRSVFEQGGTGYGAAYKTGFTSPAYGKSGTSQDYKDGIFAGFNDREVTVTWVGMDSNRSILLPSESNSALIWCQYMKQSSKNYSYSIQIPKNMVLKEVCTESGLLAGIDCTKLKKFYFWQDGLIPERCYIHSDEIF